MARVPVGNTFQVILVFRFGLPESTCRNYFGHDLASQEIRGIDVRDCVFRNPLLFVCREKDRRAVTCPGVITLAVQRRRIMDLEEELQEPTISELLRVEDNFDRFRVPFMVTVSCVCDIAACISDSRRNHAREAAQEILHPPKTTASK